MKGPPLVERLRTLLAELPDNEAFQLRKAYELFQEVLAAPDLQLSHGQCRRAGDCLIALEGMDHATHALSTNAREWERICEIISLDFVRIDYPAEKAI
jgi:hypothetical protein